jgi:6-phosphogluconolactonase (cycloisomerase 2 family)
MLADRRIAVAAVLLTALLSGACSSSHSTHLAYVTMSSGINAYRIDSVSGAITSIFSSPFVVGNSPYGIVTDASSQFAYVANQGDNTISLLKIDATSGTLKEVLPRTNAGQSPGPMIMDPSGHYLFVANQGSNDISVFSVAASGVLSPVSQPSGSLTVPVGSIPTTVSMPNSGNFLYVSVPTFSSVYAFTVSAGALAPAPGSPVSVANGLSSVAASPTGNFVFVPNPATNTISGYSVQTSSAQNLLQLLPSSPFANICSTTCTSPFGAAVDPSGKYLYIANYASTNVSQYTINSSSGALTTITTTTPTAGTNPAFIRFDPGGRFVYVANVGNNSITELKLKPTDGSLSSTSNSIQVGGVPRALAFTH